MNRVKAFLTAALTAACACAFAQLPPVKVYDTGEKLQKPLVMTPFVEFSHARLMPEVQYQTLTGEKVDLAKYHGKLLILNIWATWCAPCLKEIPQLTALQKRFAKDKIAILGVSIDEDAKQLEAFLKKYKMQDFDTVIDPKQESEKIMPLSIVPTNYIIDGRGNLVGYLPGYLPWDDAGVVPFLKKLAAKYAEPNAPEATK
jgi:thiol-disulfide isomerase/thioredoxin